MPPPFSRYALSSKPSPCLHLSLSNSPLLFSLCNHVSVFQTLLPEILSHFLLAHLSLFVWVGVLLSFTPQLWLISLLSLGQTGGNMLESACSQCQNRVCPTLPCSGISWDSRDHQSMEFPYELIFSTTTIIPFSPRAHLTTVGASTSPSSPQAV